ncbi:PrsW family intramembrane metalloprotease [Nonomuraea sp. NPDC050556]|uniref:PrsW family intramembrane metalloprotease n=1 Tax=Nonomuraea sp. NPDC050556 TaxID=3364369 RepID=UPI0037AB8D83
MIIVLVVSGLCALLTLAGVVLSGSLAGAGLSALLGVAPVPVLLAGVLALDRLEPEPRLNLVVTFVWGAGAAVLLAIVGQLIGGAFFASLGYGTQAVQGVSMIVLAPLTEEAFKGAILLLLLRRRTEIDGLTDGIIYAAMSAIGFATMENVLYYLQSFQAGGAGGAAQTFLLRGVIDPLGHPIYTSMLGIGIAYAVTRRGAWRFVAIPLGYAGAVFLHGFWNGMAFLNSLPGLALSYVVVLVAGGCLVAVTVRERQVLVSRISHYLPGYGVAPQDVTMLGSLRSRREARRWARRAGVGRQMADFQQAATELAMLHQRTEREHLDPRTFTEERDALLAAMNTTHTW